MLMGPAHVPLTLMTRLGKALAATIARDSPRAQLTVMAGLNCAESEEVRHRIETIDARKSLVRVRMDCLLVGKWGTATQRGKQRLAATISASEPAGRFILLLATATLPDESPHAKEKFVKIRICPQSGPCAQVRGYIARSGLSRSPLRLEKDALIGVIHRFPHVRVYGIVNGRGIDLRNALGDGLTGNG